jgi:futalosine hydrolase
VLDHHSTPSSIESGSAYHGRKIRVLIVTAVPAERDAVQRGLREDDRFEVLAGGVGPAAAAASTMAELVKREYDLVVSAGIGGGFPGRATVGSLVVADEIIAADLGAETPDGFLSLDELGFGSSRIAVDRERVERVAVAFQAAGLPATVGPVLTVSTVTGTAESAARLSTRVPGAAAEAMEGYGVAAAASMRDVPVLEIRAVSNPVGPRDRDSWRIKEALDRLAEASAVLREVLG